MAVLKSLKSCNDNTVNGVKTALQLLSEYWVTALGWHGSNSCELLKIPHSLRHSLFFGQLLSVVLDKLGGQGPAEPHSFRASTVPKKRILFLPLTELLN